MKLRVPARRSDERVGSLRALPELAGVSTRRLRTLAALFDETTVASGTRLARAGRPAAEFWVVLDGSAVEAGGSGRRLPAGSSIGWKAMWDRADSPATVIAVEPARVLVMGRAQFRGVRALLAPSQ